MHDRFTIADAIKAVDEAADGEYSVLLEHGSMQLGCYRPDRTDDQTPHEQDEIYIVQSGSGTFRIGDETRAFAPGDALFVRAGIEHRFEEFSTDFAAWVIFYGPAGGEENE